MNMSANVAVPILLASDPHAGIPSHFVSAIQSNCPNGWASFQYTGKDEYNENFDVVCG